MSNHKSETYRYLRLIINHIFHRDACNHNLFHDYFSTDSSFIKQTEDGLMWMRLKRMNVDLGVPNAVDTFRYFEVVEKSHVFEGTLKFLSVRSRRGGEASFPFSS